jgi:hypothetical protein
MEALDPSFSDEERERRLLGTLLLDSTLLAEVTALLTPKIGVSIFIVLFLKSLFILLSSVSRLT